MNGEHGLPWMLLLGGGLFVAATALLLYTVVIGVQW